MVKAPLDAQVVRRRGCGYDPSVAGDREKRTRWLLLLLLLALGVSGGVWLWWGARDRPAASTAQVPPASPPSAPLVAADASVAAVPAPAPFAPALPSVAAAPAPPAVAAARARERAEGHGVAALAPGGRRSGSGRSRGERAAAPKTPAEGAERAVASKTLDERASAAPPSEGAAPPPVAPPAEAPSALPPAPQGGLSLQMRDRAGGAYQLVRSVYQLDGRTLVDRHEPAGAAHPEEREAWHGQVPAGPHHIAVLLEYQGKGFGVFTYLAGYRYKVRASKDVTVAKDGRLELTVDAHARTDVGASPEQALTLDLVVGGR